MRFFVTDRAQGKTTKLMREALKIGQKEPTCVLVIHKQEALRLRDLYRKELIGNKLEIFSYQEFSLIVGVRKFKHIYIDNADFIMYGMVRDNLDYENGGNIRLVTATGLPVHDMKLIKEAGAALWQEAADILLRENNAGSTAQEIATIFLDKAKGLAPKEKGDGIRNGGGEGSNP